MPEFVYDMPLRQMAVLFAIVTVGAMIVGLLVVKPLLRLLMGGAGPDFNEALGYATSGFGLFYGLLLGLLTVAAYQNSERVRDGLLGEATAVSALYADMNSYPEPIRSDMKAMLRDYVLFTAYKDWPAHQRGEFLNGGGNRAGAMRQKLAGFEPQTVGQEILHAEVLAAFQAFVAWRHARLAGVLTEIPNVLWYVVLVGAAINVLLLVLLRMRLLQQFVIGTIISFFLGVILVALDRPLRGEAGIAPTAFQVLWERVMVWDEPLS